MLRAYDHKGIGYETFEDMCDAYNLKPKTVKARLHRGKTTEEALTTPLTHTTRKGSCKDHEGTEFPSETKMCEHWGIPLMTYRQRLSRGISLEDALSLKSGSCNSVVDHEGTEFATVTALCRHWGVTTEMFKRKRKQGCTIEQALDNDYTGKGYEDYLGNKFTTWQEYADHWGMKRNTLSYRVKSGLKGKNIVEGSPLAMKMIANAEITGLKD